MRIGLCFWIEFEYLIVVVVAGSEVEVKDPFPVAFDTAGVIERGWVHREEKTV